MKNIVEFINESKAASLYDILYKYFNDENDYAYDDDWIADIERLKIDDKLGKGKEIYLFQDESSTCYLQVKSYDEVVEFTALFTIGSDDEIQAELTDDKHNSSKKDIEDMMKKLGFGVEDDIYVLRKI